MEPPIPLDDEIRVATLNQYGILDQPPAPDLEELCWLAATVCGAPISAITLVDAERASMAAAHGMPPANLARRDSMCAHAVGLGRPLHVADCSADPRFAPMPLVDGRIAAARMYAAVPLTTDEGQTIGALCVADVEVRTLTDRQLEGLDKVGHQVVRALEMRRHTSRLIEATSEADHRATHDNLTGLANRQTLVDRLEVALASSQETGVGPNLLFCDVDRFRTVNHLFGPHVGDAVLTAVGARIKQAARPWDTAARLGNDQFVVLCEDLDQEAALATEERVADAASGPVPTNVGTVMVSVTVIRVTASPEDSVLDVLRLGDARLAASKREG